MLVKKIEKLYGTIDSVLCFDRGMVSDANLSLLSSKNIEFISALDGSQVKHFEDYIDFTFLKKIKKLDLAKQSEQIKKAFIQKGFKCEDNSLFYKEFSLSQGQKHKIEEKTLKLNLTKRRYFLAFNPEQAYLAQKHRTERVACFEE